MNLRQLSYVIALASERHFERAAKKSFVSQSTLSTMIQKLEDELGVLLFERSSKPITITKEGEVLIEKMRNVLMEVEALSTIVQEMKGEIKGELSIAAIPTVAPFLLPRIVWKFGQRFPKIKMELKELTTEHILNEIEDRKLDIGILGTPIQSPSMIEYPLYHEPFYLLDYNSDKVPPKVNMDKVDFSKMYLLEEGHCLNEQVDNICNISNRNLNPERNITFKAGSIDSLIRVTKINKGITLLPKLATTDFTKSEQKRLSHFKDKSAFRTIRLVTHQHFVKKRLLNSLQGSIKENVKPYLI